MNVNNLSVKTRLGLGFSVVIIIGIIVSVFGRGKMVAIGEEMDVLINDRIVQYQKVGEIRNNAATVARLVRNIALLTDATAMRAEHDRIIKLRESNQSIYSELEQAIDTSTGKELLLLSHAARVPYNAVLDKAIALGMDNHNDEARDVLLLESRPLQVKYFKALDDLQAYENQRMAESGERSRTIVREAGRWMLIGALLAAILGAVVAWRLTRTLTGQLGGEPAYASNVARQIAGGNLAVDVVLAGGDRHSMLAAMREMRDSLSRVVAQVRASSDSVAAASSQIAQGNQDLSARTEAQASALEQTAASMEELHSAVQKNADHANAANRLAIRASGVASEGGAVVSEVVQTMRDINQSSRQINDIIGVIDAIAFQTNILALNAAVEAARAGEQGRGFAVVASEVRVLAGRSAQAAKEIKALIGASVERVEQGTALVDRAGSTMASVVDAIRQVTQIMSEITHASQEQALGVAAVGAAVSQMDQATQQNASLVEEMAAAAGMMREQAQDLVQAVSVFQLELDQPGRHARALRTIGPERELSLLN
ncbi:MAG: methyl-accepting chemotaxis protein [Sphingomonadaceae bacterium]